jgi:hypothetical protein
MSSHVPQQPTEGGGQDAMARLTRRTVLSMVLSVGVSPWSAVAAEEASALPTEVAGITIPRSRIAVLAAQFARRSCPEYLFNHCMRTFLFGALALQRQGLAYNADEAFTAAALHDLGLLPAFASASQGFEVDGANAAEKFARNNGLNCRRRQCHLARSRIARWALRDYAPCGSGSYASRPRRG